MVERTERGWLGHGFDYNSRFRRNTLLRLGEVRVIVSTVGNSWELGDEGYKRSFGPPYYITHAFLARQVGRYWEVDHRAELNFDAECYIKDWEGNDGDLRADAMHEAVVAEMIARMEAGEFKNPQPESPDADHP